MWGLLAGLFNSIPYMGPPLVTGGLALVAFMQFDDLAQRSTSAPPRSPSPVSKDSC